MMTKQRFKESIARPFWEVTTSLLIIGLHIIVWVATLLGLALLGDLPYLFINGLFFGPLLGCVSGYLWITDKPGDDT
jgi:hypothetical protein